MKLNQIFRSLFRDKLNSIIIVISLSAGIACINLIFLFLKRETGTDGFHKDKDRTYILKCDDPWIPGATMYFCRYGSAEFMKNNFSQVEDFCRLSNAGAQKIIVNNETYYDDTRILSSSSNFFSFFSYELLTKNPETALESKNSLVISSDLAEKYFGTEEPLGKVIDLVYKKGTERMIVSGVFEKPVESTQINFDMVRLTGEQDGRCYLKLVKGADPAELEKLFLGKKDVIPIVHTGTPGTYYLEPFQEAYYSSARSWFIENNRDKKDLQIALTIGLMILLIAMFNYLGIVANKFYRKGKEYYIRRVNGSKMCDLIIRFTTENSLLILISFIVSFFFMADMLPFFNKVTDSTITMKFINQPEQLILLAVVLLITIFVTAAFSSFLIHAGLDINLLKADQSHPVKSIQVPAFNIFQIASTIALIICSLVIIRQMNYISAKPIGLDKEVIEIRIPPQYNEKAVVFKEELLKNASVNSVSLTQASPLLEHFMVGLKYDDDGVEKEYYPSGFSGDENYLKVLGIELIEGTGFSGISSSTSKKCLVNESFARLFKGRDLIGKGIPGMEDVIITGIVRDFHYSDLKSKIEPAFISFDSNGGHILVKPQANQANDAINCITTIWKTTIPDFPLDIESVADRFEWFHRNNENFKNLIIACSLICLFLSMIGLLAVSYQRSNSRTKEIGIRKISGAGLINVLLTVNSDYLKWTFIAFIIASPAAWYAMNKWLEAYAYRAGMKWWICLLAGIIVFVISLLTVSIQTWKAATRNPVEALRHE